MVCLLGSDITHRKSKITKDNMCFTQHVRRSNFPSGIWKLANIAKPSEPRPDEGHGWTMEARIMKSKWTEGEVILRQLVDILEEELEDETCASDSDPDSDSEVSESDFLDRVGSDSDTESDGDDH
ncbi:Hypothetical predicted protein [Octopus vulgaris]|uniref:Uncharacterized protein n=1 Tax=Octopus vulgaris TaxID=6645 RepID=A0AA36AFH0_OCTVU|nr:Hypothetical predicted protein [Octopus vulgaris]